MPDNKKLPPLPFAVMSVGPNNNQLHGSYKTMDEAVAGATQFLRSGYINITIFTPCKSVALAAPPITTEHFESAC